MVLFVNTFISGALGLLAFDLVVCCLDSDPAKLKKCDLLKCRNGNLNNVYMRHVAFATASNMKINFPKQNVWEKRGDSLGSFFLALAKALYRLMYSNKSQQRLGDKCYASLVIIRSKEILVIPNFWRFYSILEEIAVGLS